MLKAIDPDLFTRLMTLPDVARLDLLEFLGATPVGDAQMNELIDGIEGSIRQSRAKRRAEPN